MKPMEVLLSSIRTQICGGERQIFAPSTKEEQRALYAISKSQDMAHIVGEELNAQGLLEQDEFGAKYRKQMMLAVLRYERIQYELCEICRVLEESAIRHMPLKGAVMRALYPQPWMRTSADIDLLIPDEEHERARLTIIEKLGYTCGERHEHDVSLFTTSGVHLELHFGTIEEYCAVNAKTVMDNVWQYAEPVSGYVYRQQIPDELFYFYHVAHMAKHFEYGGCGVRFFLDLWLLNQKTRFDPDKRRVLLERGGLLRFAQLAEQLSEIWFSEGVHNELTLRMQTHVLENGVYGTKRTNVAWQQISAGGKRKRALRLIFLPYEQMVNRYPSLKGRKLLLPVYHVRRWCAIVFGGRAKRSIDALKMNSEVAGGTTESVERMLRELELIS